MVPIYNSLSLSLSLCGLSLLSPKVPQLDCFLVRLACGSESSPQAEMIPNPVQLQTEKTIWSDSMLEPPDGAFGSDVLYLEKQKKGGKMWSVRSEALFKDIWKRTIAPKPVIVFLCWLGWPGNLVVQNKQHGLAQQPVFPFSSSQRLWNSGCLSAWVAATSITCVFPFVALTLALR